MCQMDKVSLSRTKSAECKTTGLTPIRSGKFACLPSSMNSAHNSNAQLHRIRSALAHVRAYQQNEYEVALYRHLEQEREKHRRERHRHIESSSQPNHRSLQAGSVLAQRAKSPLNLSAATAAALAAEKRAATAARKAADSVALVPWDSNRYALTVYENDVRKSSTSLQPSPTSTRATCGHSNSPPPSPIPPEPKRCISPRMLRLAREFTTEAREYDRRRERIQRMNALANGQPVPVNIQIPRARTPRPAVHRPSASFASPSTGTKPHRRESSYAGGHRLGDLSGMQENPDLSNVPWVHRRHAEASTRTCGRMPTVTRNSPCGSCASLQKNDNQASPHRSHRRIQPRPVYVPHTTTPSHNCSRTPPATHPPKQNSFGCAAYRMFAARHAARTSRKCHTCSHCPTANRTLPKTSDAIEITPFEDDEVPTAGASRPLGPLNSESYPFDRPSGSERSTESEPSPRRTAASAAAARVPVPVRHDTRSASLPVTSQTGADLSGATHGRESYAPSCARRRLQGPQPQPSLSK